MLMLHAGAVFFLFLQAPFSKSFSVFLSQPLSLPGVKDYHHCLIIICWILEKKMKQRMCCFLIVFMQILTSSWLQISAMSSASPQQVPEFHGVGFASNQEGYRAEKAKSGRRLGRIGSRPPNCQRKCGECTPCVATQIPTTSGELGTLYTNYEPEGWTCKCHSTFFNP